MNVPHGDHKISEGCRRRILDKDGDHGKGLEDREPYERSDCLVDDKAGKRLLLDLSVLRDLLSVLVVGVTEGESLGGEELNGDKYTACYDKKGQDYAYKAVGHVCRAAVGDDAAKTVEVTVYREHPEDIRCLVHVLDAVHADGDHYEEQRKECRLRGYYRVAYDRYEDGKRCDKKSQAHKERDRYDKSRKSRILRYQHYDYEHYKRRQEGCHADAYKISYYYLGP